MFQVVLSVVVVDELVLENAEDDAEVPKDDTEVPKNDADEPKDDADEAKDDAEVLAEPRLPPYASSTSDGFSVNQSQFQLLLIPLSI